MKSDSLLFLSIDKFDTFYYFPKRFIFLVSFAMTKRINFPCFLSLIICHYVQCATDRASEWCHPIRKRKWRETMNKIRNYSVLCPLEIDAVDRMMTRSISFSLINMNAIKFSFVIKLLHSFLCSLVCHRPKREIRRISTNGRDIDVMRSQNIRKLSTFGMPLFL